MLTWKIVGVSKASVLYIYIDYPPHLVGGENQALRGLGDLGFICWVVGY